MKMEKRKFRIGELAEQLNVERFVIRFWEKEFNFKGHRSYGGQRFYDEQDLKQFQTIKELLYEKKFTIAGAKQVFKKNSVSPSQITASQKTTLESEEKTKHSYSSANKKNSLEKNIYKKLLNLRKSLLELKNTL